MFYDEIYKIKLIISNLSCVNEILFNYMYVYDICIWIVYKICIWINMLFGTVR